MHNFRAPLETLKSLNEVDYGKNGYDADGVMLYKSFLSKDLVESINSELDVLLMTETFNQVINGSIWKNKNYKEITLPSSLKSVNILELGVDLFEKFIPEETKPYSVITHINIYSEISNNIVPWHSDQLKNIMKFNILLRGGGADSGEFYYINRSNKIDHSVIGNEHSHNSHHLSESELTAMSSFISKHPAQPGDILQFDSYGFHYRGQCLEERRNIFIEIQDIRDGYPKREFYLSNKLLSEKVLQNIKIYRKDPRCIYLVNQHHHTAIPGSLFSKILFKFLILNFIKIAKKLKLWK